MFAGDGALKRLQMCADCRVVDMMENKSEISIGESSDERHGNPAHVSTAGNPGRPGARRFTTRCSHGSFTPGPDAAC